MPMKNMCMLDEIAAKRDEIYAIAKKHKAEKLWVFGSCARREERPDSDVDLLVKWMPGEYSWRNECAMSSACEKLLGNRVDIVSSRILPQSPGFARRVCKEAVPIWRILRLYRDDSRVRHMLDAMERIAFKNPDIDWKGLSGVRHKIVHDYADIDYDTIWDILQNDVPVEYEKLKALAATLPIEPTQPPPNLADFL